MTYFSLLCQLQLSVCQNRRVRLAPCVVGAHHISHSTCSGDTGFKFQTVAWWLVYTILHWKQGETNLVLIPVFYNDIFSCTHKVLDQDYVSFASFSMHLALCGMNAAIIRMVYSFIEKVRWDLDHTKPFAYTLKTLMFWYDMMFIKSSSEMWSSSNYYLIFDPCVYGTYDTTST